MSFGTMMETSDKTVDGLSAEYTLHMFNMGDDELEVEFHIHGLERSEYQGLEPVVLSPSNTSEEPLEGATYIDGLYVQPHSETFTVEMERQREDREMEFQLEAVAQLPESVDGDMQQRVVHERVHELTMETRTVILDPEEESGDLWREIDDLDEEEQEERIEEYRNGTVEEENTDNRTAEGTETGTGDSGRTLTAVLATGVALSLLYLWSVL